VATALIACAALLAIAAVALMLVRGAVSQPARTLAVMPFVNSTGEAGLDYLGEGIANDVHGDLVRRSKLNVASFLTVLGLKRPMRPGEVGRELGVGAVLEGALRRDGGATAIDVELVDAVKGTVLWTERFDYTRSAAIDIKERIVRGVAERLTGHPPAAARAPATRSMDAYDLYLKAGALLDEPDDPQAPDRALALYEQALALDRDFALAWAGAARARVRIWGRDKSPEPLRRAEEAADRALQLNPNLVEAHIARAQVYRETSRYDQSIRELRAIQAINPGWDEVWLQLAATYRVAGDLERSEASLREALKLRPENWRPYNTLGLLLARRGDYAGARQQFRQIVRLVPEKNRGYEQLAAVELLTGNFAGAIEQYHRLPAPVKDGTLASNIGSAYFFVRQMPAARAWYQLAVDLEPRTHTWRMNLGDWFLREQRPDSARGEFEAASGLIGEVLEVSPKKATLWLDRALCQAKLGDCDAAHSTLATIRAALPDSDAQSAHEIARLEATCGRRDLALDALERAVKYGVPVAAIRVEDEFQGLAGEPRFKSLAARTP
jgi:TolB-like protein/Flp pilus assembly protein TadD